MLVLGSTRSAMNKGEDGVERLFHASAFCGGQFGCRVSRFGRLLVTRHGSLSIYFSLGFLCPAAYRDREGAFNSKVPGVTDRLWSVEDLVALWKAYEQRRAERAA
jgi:hypothetical protein